jgi:hypothetical protein
MNKHKHAELIKQWADGAEIEVYCKSVDTWFYNPNPNWANSLEYRVKSKKPLRFILVREVSGDSSKVSENFPHKDVETYFKIHELVQEHETDWDKQDCEVYKDFFEEKYEMLTQRGKYVKTLGTIRMSKQCAEKLCEMLNNGEIEL